MTKANDQSGKDPAKESIVETSRVKQSLQQSFVKDKTELMHQANEYLRTSPETNAAVNEQSMRSQVLQDFRDDRLEDAIKSLERSRDLKNGIVTTLKSNINGVDILIRDARNVFDESNLSTESFEMQYLNIVRAAMDIVEIERKPELKAQIQDKARQFIENFYENNKDIKQTVVKKNVNDEIIEVVQFLESQGIEDARNKLNVAKEFQNLKDKQANIVTISNIDHNGTSYALVEAEVGLRGITSEQKAEYEKIKNNYNPLGKNNDLKSQPEWFQRLESWERELCHRNIDPLISGERVISTQLRQIVGMKNAFEKITAIKENDSRSQNLEIIQVSKHAGTLASFTKDAKDNQGQAIAGDEEKRDKERARITKLNARQAQEWIGSNKQLHCITLNSGPDLGTSADKVIVRSTAAAMAATGGRETNLAYNALRVLGKANVLDGVKNMISDISQNLKIDPEIAKLQTYLQLKDKKGQKVTKIGSSKEGYKIVSLLVEKGKLSPEVGDIIKDTIALTKMVNKADQTFRFTLDVNNINADIATAQNNLMNKIAKIKLNAVAPLGTAKGLVLSKISAEESLTMCASGKDRTGFAQHDFTSRAVKSYIEDKSKQEISLSKLDSRILKSRHTASQAGNPYAGGASIGCHGTKIDNLQSLPMARFRALQAIIETSSSGNNLPSKITVKKQTLIEKMKNKIFSNDNKKASTKDVIAEISPTAQEITSTPKTQKFTKSNKLSTTLKELEAHMKEHRILRTDSIESGIVIGRQRLKSNLAKKSSNQR